MTVSQLLHFAVTYFHVINTQLGCIVECYTNNPCHLWMRWTSIVPQKHINPVVRRGATVGTYIDQCFVVYEDNEQQEPGDTIIHTFLKEPWPPCTERWFYFWGTVAVQLSPSVSAIFYHHRICVPVEPPFITLFTEPWTPTEPSWHAILVELWSP